MSARLSLAVALVAFGIGCGAKPSAQATFEKVSSDADRRAAMAQKACPVTDARLYSMGAPIKVSSGERHFFICCASCEEDAAADFDSYFAKVNE